MNENWGSLRKLQDEFPQYFAKREEGGIGFNCGPGWHPIIRSYLKMLTVIQDRLRPIEAKILQIKEKFGYLRIYVRSSDEGVHGFAKTAEEASQKYCEFCGSTKNIETKNWANWMKTLCPSCGEKYASGKRPWAEGWE